MNISVLIINIYVNEDGKFVSDCFWKDFGELYC